MPPSPPPRRRRPLRRRIQLWCLALLVVVAALALVLVVAELILRARTDHPLHVAHSIRGLYRNTGDGNIEVTPDWQGRATIEGRTVTMTTNSLGLRGAEIGPKQPGETRVLVLGDSMVFGQAMNDDETFPARMQQHAREQGLQWTVGNAGMTGAGIREQSANVERFRPAFRPDRVLSCIYIGNDFVDDLQEDKTIVDGYPLRGSYARLARESWRFRMTVRFHLALELELFLRENLPALALEIPRDRPALPPPDHPLAWTEGIFLDRVTGEDPPHVRRIFANTRKHLRAVMERAGDVPVSVVLLPTSIHVIPGQYRAFLEEVGFDPARFRKGRLQHRLEQLCGELGLPVLDLTPKLAGDTEPAANWLPRDRHFSVRGNRRVGRWLVEHLRDGP